MTFDELVKKEIEKNFTVAYQEREARALESQNINTQKENKEFYLLLLLIIRSIKNKKTLKHIKKLIKESKLEDGLLIKIKKYITKQGEIIFGEPRESKEIFKQKTTYGETIQKEAEIRKKNLNKYLLGFIAGYKELERKAINDYVFNYIQNYRRNLRGHIKSQMRSAEALQKKARDKIIERVTEIEKWVWITRLDKRTSPACIALNGRVYKKKDYPNGVPQRPPLHSKCRCRITTIIRTRRKVKQNIIKTENPNTFYQRNVGIAKGLLGENKYKIWNRVGISLNSITDIARDRFYNNAELINKFDIGVLKKIKGLNRIQFDKINKSKLKTLIKEGVIEFKSDKIKKSEFLKKINKDLLKKQLRWRK